MDILTTLLDMDLIGVAALTAIGFFSYFIAPEWVQMIKERINISGKAAGMLSFAVVAIFGIVESVVLDRFGIDISAWGFDYDAIANVLTGLILSQVGYRLNVRNSGLIAR